MSARAVSMPALFGAGRIEAMGYLYVHRASPAGQSLFTRVSRRPPAVKLVARPRRPRMAPAPATTPRRRRSHIQGSGPSGVSAEAIQRLLTASSRTSTQKSEHRMRNYCTSASRTTPHCTSPTLGSFGASPHWELRECPQCRRSFRPSTTAMMPMMATTLAAPRSSSGGMGCAFRKARADGYSLSPFRRTVSSCNASGGLVPRPSMRSPFGPRAQAHHSSLLRIIGSISRGSRRRP